MRKVQGNLSWLLCSRLFVILIRSTTICFCYLLFGFMSRWINRWFMGLFGPITSLFFHVCPLKLCFVATKLSLNLRAFFLLLQLVFSCCIDVYTRLMIKIVNSMSHNTDEKFFRLKAVIRVTTTIRFLQICWFFFFLFCFTKKFFSR
jgi:uncharacterized membrane protein YGL010W